MTHLSVHSGYTNERRAPGEPTGADLWRLAEATPEEEKHFSERELGIAALLDTASWSEPSRSNTLPTGSARIVLSALDASTTSVGAHREPTTWSFQPKAKTTFHEARGIPVWNRYPSTTIYDVADPRGAGSWTPAKFLAALDRTWTPIRAWHPRRLVGDPNHSQRN